jgi:predicted small lipoprotein YifL
MLKTHWIVGLACVVLLTACGQKGALVLPKEPAAQNRATLPQVLNPASPASSPASAPR